MIFKKGEPVIVKEPKSGGKILTTKGKFHEYVQISGAGETDYCFIQISPYSKLFTLTDFVSKGRVQ